MNSFLSNPIYLLVLLAFLTLAPIFLMMVTSFVKTSIVFSILRSAIGAQQIPPNIVLMGFSLVLTLYIMHPVAVEMQSRIKENMEGINIKSADSWAVLYKTTESALPVLRNFLQKNSSIDVKKMFVNLSSDIRKKENLNELNENELVILVPSFVVTELQEAFEMGVLIYLPFLIIDMLVSSILISMGMHMLSPVTVSLPFKLLLFVLADGWQLISRGIIMGYIY